MSQANLMQHVPLGRTGLMVGRLGLASGYGVPAAAIERAFHEHRVNYFYISLLRRGRMLTALRRLLPQHRDEIVVVLSKPVREGYFMRSFVERWLRKLGIDQIDVLILGSVNRPPPGLLLQRAHALRQADKVRFIGMSSHQRPLLGSIAAGKIDTPIDLVQLRYNAVHRGAEQDIFPRLAKEREARLGTVCFTATCWRRLLKAGKMPHGEPPLTAADCYRFALSRPEIDVCVTGPSTAKQLEENLRALVAGAMSEQELARARRIGDHLYHR